MGTRREFLAQAAAVLAAGSAGAALATVQTVQGRIDASQLGFTLPHQHVLACSASFWQARPAFLGGRATFTSRIVDKLKAAKDAGVRTVVDVTPIAAGRDIRLLEQVSRMSGMQIVASTGHWLLPSLAMAARTADELADSFVRDIERGIEGTDIKPGVIKVAADPEGVTSFLERVLRAAARASKATGLPVTTHVHATVRDGKKQADIFESEGVNPASVCLCQGDGAADMPYLTGLLERGYTVGIGQPVSGDRFSRQMLLSKDWYFGIGNETLLDSLRGMGMSARQIHTLTVLNPQRFFGPP